ncbi:MAG: hypothetical protein GXX91_16695, partial [Verrucomicrobiaceae bacterium]|nr:hypothetical protein [Verrucomicrobiaceae bacterium]
LNELLITAPEIALGDESLDPAEGHWRLLPLPGAVEEQRRSLAVQVSSHYHFIVEEFREYGVLRNLPVIVNVHAAPLEAMAAAPLLVPESALVNGIFLFQYGSFTYLFATGPKKELLLVRPLLHRSEGHLSPFEIAEVIKSTGALLNIRTPTITYFSLTGMASEEIGELLEPTREENPDSTLLCLAPGQLDFLEGVPDRRFEFWVAVHPAKGNETAPGAAFGELRKHWAAQDFYGLARSERELMPTRGDLQLLKASRWFQRVAVLAVLVFAGWTGADFIAKMRTEAWELDEGIAAGMDEKLVSLQKEKREWDHWSGLLAKRSEGWLALEALLEIFPNSAGVILKDASYRVETLDTGKSKALGMKHQWTVTGYANPEVATELPTLGSRTRAAQIMNRIAEENHADYLSVKEETRDVQVSLQQKQGTMPPSLEFPAKMARHFRTSFDLSIAQSFSAEDDLALTTERK